MANNVIVLESEPGIQKDGTLFDSKNYIDGQWVRFYRRRPLKIAGYRIIDNGTNTIIRTIFNFDNQIRPNSIDVYIGRSNFVGYINFNLNGIASLGEIARIPIGYIPNNSNLWDFDIFIDNLLGSLIVAHVAPNANDINNTTEGQVYFGITGDDSALTPVIDANNTPVVCSGGIVYASPILIVYGNNGLIRWCTPGKLNGPASLWSTTVNHQSISNSKILKMIATRGSSQPQLLAWTNSSIINLSYTVTNSSTVDPVVSFFTAITLDDGITVMSPNSIVGYANKFYWMGLKQFYLFTGIVNILPNTMNSQFLFQRINLSQRSKVFAQIVSPGTGSTEIWWHVPLITQEVPNPTENNHVIIYDIDLKVWSDTPLNRTAGVKAGIFPLPIMSDNQLVNGGYPLWMHETGVDEVTALPTNPPTPISPVQVKKIPSYFRTHIYTLFEGNPSNNIAMRTRRIEPDFEMNGNMTVTVYNGFFPSDTPPGTGNGQLIVSDPYTFDLNTQKIDAVNSQGRFVSFMFESNEVGGTYQMGKTLLNYTAGDREFS